MFVVLFCMREVPYWSKSVFGNLFLVLGLVLSSGCYGVITLHDDRYWLSAKQCGGFRRMAGWPFLTKGLLLLSGIGITCLPCVLSYFHVI